MAKDNSGTDTSRNGETAGNTPSNAADKGADTNQAGPDTSQPAAPVSRDEASAQAANSGVDYNERVGKFKEEFKQDLGNLQEQVKALVHKLDDLG